MSLCLLISLCPGCVFQVGVALGVLGSDFQVTLGYMYRAGHDTPSSSLVHCMRLTLATEKGHHTQCGLVSEAPRLMSRVSLDVCVFP